MLITLLISQIFTSGVKDNPPAPKASNTVDFALLNVTCEDGPDWISIFDDCNLCDPEPQQCCQYTLAENGTRRMLRTCVGQHHESEVGPRQTTSPEVQHI